MLSCVLAFCGAADKADGLARPGPILDNIEGPVVPSLTPLSLNASALHPIRCLHLSVSRPSIVVWHTILRHSAVKNMTGLLFVSRKLLWQMAEAGNGKAPNLQVDVASWVPQHIFLCLEIL